MKKFFNIIKYIIYIYLGLFFINNFKEHIGVPLSEVILEYFNINISNNTLYSSLIELFIFGLCIVPIFYLYTFFQPNSVWLRAYKKYEKNNYESALKLFEQLAIKGHQDAQMMTGLIYSTEQFSGYDQKKAIQWHIKAARQGNDASQCYIAFMYHHGEGLEQSYKRAIKWYRRSAKTIEVAQYQMGILYFNGFGVSVDYKKAMSWFKRAADQGMIDAFVFIGLLYQEGKGVNIDYDEAMKYYNLAAKQNDANAKLCIGMLYNDGLGVKQNFAEAVQWFKKAAEQGVSNAQFNMGLAFDIGEGVLKNSKEAIRWYQLAVEQGNVSAMINLGIIYYKGEGTNLDKKEAKKLFKLASENDSGIDNDYSKIINNEDDENFYIPQKYLEELKKQNTKVLKPSLKEKNLTNENIIFFPLNQRKKSK